MPPKKKVIDKRGNVVDWNLSLARDLLILDVKEGRITGSTTLKDAHNARPEYMHYQEAAFKGYLETIIGQMGNKESRAERDDSAVKQFRQLHPKPATNHRGEPRWEGSAAEAKLKAVVDKGEHKQKDVKPRHLRDTDEDFQAFQPKTFRNHIYQEVKSRKFQNYVKDKAEQKRKNTTGGTS